MFKTLRFFVRLLKLEESARLIKMAAISRSRTEKSYDFSVKRPTLETISFSSFPQFVNFIGSNQEWVTTCELADQTSVVDSQSSYSVHGFCVICNAESNFVVARACDFSQRPTSNPNWREELECSGCGFNNRTRAALHLAIHEFGMIPSKQIYITEQFGYLYRWLRGNFANIQGSEYLPSTKRSWLKRLGISHQDVQKLTFPSGELDFVLSFDVLEHIPNPEAAFQEFARVLKPSGCLILTVPFTLHEYQTTVRAVMQEDGEIEYLLPIETHGNPADTKNGSLCYRHFGWDALEQLRNNGFSEVKAHVYHSSKFGHLGALQLLISAVK